MDPKTATFGPGPLGIRMKGSPLGIRITNVEIGSAAIAAGVKIGDFICGINGKPLKDLLKGHPGKGFSDTELVEYVTKMERPITFHFNSMTKAPAPAAPASTANSGAPPPPPVLLPAGEKGEEFNQDKVQVKAGCKLKVDLPKAVRAGSSIRVEFWVEEVGMDIWFSIQRRGKTDLVYPYAGVYDTTKHCGPASFQMKEDEELSFMWDNSHSWFNGKTVSYRIAIE